MKPEKAQFENGRKSGIGIFTLIPEDLKGRLDAAAGKHRAKSSAIVISAIEKEVERLEKTESVF